MNTLSRAITAQIFTQPDTYLILRKHWSRLINSDRKHELSAEHHLLYLALLGKDWRKTFTPVTNRRKRENGAFYGWGLFRALRMLHLKFYEEALLAPFEGIVTPEMLAQVRSLIAVHHLYSYSAEQFYAGRFPFEAYTLPEALLSDISNRNRDHA
jgi:hypothetical protein